MRRVITITDLTRMQHGRVCIAGYLDDRTCVRPVFRFGGLMESWLFRNGEVVTRPFARVEFDFGNRPPPQRPHTEDWIIDEEYRESRGVMRFEEREQFLEEIADASVDSIFDAAIHRDAGCFINEGDGNRSLGTVRVRAIDEVVYRPRNDGGWDYRVEFLDGSGQTYRLAVTDLAFRYKLDDMRDSEEIPPHRAALQLLSALRISRTYLRIGLARGWELHPDRCYLQITGVHSFPDYLERLCFADFRRAGKTIER